MRRIVRAGLTLLPVLLFAGCNGTAVENYVGDPSVGFVESVSDTHTWTWRPTSPAGQSENERLVRGEEVAVAPLLPEPGDVWPGPPAAIPTMQDLQNLNNKTQLPPPNIPNGTMTPVFPQNGVVPGRAKPTP